MFERLELMLKRFEEITLLLGQAEVIADQKKWQKLVKERAGMEEAVDLYKKYLALEKNIKECKEIIDESDDHEMIVMAKEELSNDIKSKEDTVEEIKIALLPVDPNDDKNVIVEVRAGAGGEEAGLFGAQIVRMYMRFAERMRWKVQEIDMNYTELGGAKEVTFMISGEGAFSKLKFESGVHRVQRVPDTETQGRVHTSTITVAVLPEVENVEIDMNERDFRIDT
ncbi:MAG: PCRF domain-containing protein, partial [Clostridia bacterium]